jgi:hypothetical protein
MDNILDSYLVNLGFNIDQAGLQRFGNALKAAEGSVGAWTSQISRAFGAQSEAITNFIGSANVVASTTAGMVEDILKFQGAVVGVFTAASTAIVGMVDKLAMADQGYRLFGLHMLMNEQAAKRLKIAQDALGASLGEIVWDPELHKNFITLQQDQEAYQKSQGEGFAAAMRGWRDLHLQIERVKVGLLYLAQSVVARLFETMGVNIDAVTAKIQEFLAVLHNPEQFQKLVDLIAGKLKPILLDTWNILKGVGEVIYQAGVAFQNLIGIISGDTSLDGAAVTFDSIAKSVQHVVDGILWFEEGIIKAEKIVLHFVNALLDLKNMNFKGFGDELMAALKEVSAVAAGIIGALVGTLAGGVLGFLMGGPAGALLGMGIGATALGGIGYQAGKLKEILSGEITYDDKGHEIRKDSTKELSSDPNSSIGTQAFAMAQKAGEETGLDPKLIFEQWFHETGGFKNRGATSLNNLGGMRIPGSTEYQAFGSLEDYEKRYVALLKSARYQMQGILGSRSEEDFAGALKRGSYYEDAYSNYVSGMKSASSQYARQQQIAGSSNINVGDIHINITNPKSAEDARRGAQEGVHEALRRQTQYDLAVTGGQ